MQIYKKFLFFSGLLFTSSLFVACEGSNLDSNITNNYHGILLSERIATYNVENDITYIPKANTKASIAISVNEINLLSSQKEVSKAAKLAVLEKILEASDNLIEKNSPLGFAKIKEKIDDFEFFISPNNNQEKRSYKLLMRNRKNPNGTKINGRAIALEISGELSELSSNLIRPLIEMRARNGLFDFPKISKVEARILEAKKNQTKSRLAIINKLFKVVEIKNGQETTRDFSAQDFANFELLKSQTALRKQTNDNNHLNIYRYIFIEKSSNKAKNLSQVFAMTSDEIKVETLPLNAA